MGLLIRSSRIHREGCYTTTPIRRGTRIIEYTGERISIPEADRRYDGDDITYLFGLTGGKQVIDGTGIAALINHSCDPNCEADEYPRAGVDLGHPRYPRRRRTHLRLQSV